MTSANGGPTRTGDMFPDALSADRAYLVTGDMSGQPCVFYFRKSIGDDFDTQVLRCVQYARSAGLRLDPLGRVGRTHRQARRWIP